MLAFDCDECGEGDVDRSAAAVRKYIAVVHTTFSATRKKPKHRIVLALSRPLARAEHQILWQHVARRLAANGVRVDAACSDLARLYYVPELRPGGLWMARVLRGLPIHVDRTLNAARASASARSPSERPVVSGNAHRALVCAAHAVAVATEGARNHTLNRETFGVARFVELPDDAIIDAMMDAARRAGLEDREATKTIASALRARGRLAK